MKIRLFLKKTKPTLKKSSFINFLFAYNFRNETVKFLKSTNKLMPFLIDEERAQLRAQHKQERDRHIADRIKTVMLSDKGWSVQQISEALFLSEDAIRQHLKEYAFSRKLKPEGGGSDEKLSREQSQQLEAHLGQHTYLHAKDIVA